MAIGQISGPLLKANLLRQGIDLAFQTDLLYLSVVDTDPANHRIGVKTTTPGYTVDVNGILNASNLKTPILTVGSVNITENSGTITVDGNLHTTGNITADGSITLGDANTDNVVFAADVNSDILPDITDTYALGNSSQRWNSLTSKSSTIGDLSLSTDTIGVANLASNIVLKPSTSGFVIIDSATALKIPVGDATSQPTGQAGFIRFNSTSLQFEGYQGSVWSSLGGVRSTDNKTYIIAEATPGANDNILYFYANDIEQARITPNYTQITKKLQVQDTTESTNTTTGSITTAGGIGVAGSVFIGGDLTVSQGVNLTLDEGTY